VLVQKSLELVDVSEAAADFIVGQLIVHLRQDYLLVIGAVEDHELAVAWGELVGAPQEMVGFLFRGRLLEGRDPA
jgi:hypothetical protein